MRLALRSLAKSPGFTLSAVALIAVGLAVSTSAFTLVHALFFKPRQGLADPAALHNLHPARDSGSFGSWSYPDYLAVRERLTQFSGLTAFTGLETGLALGDRSASVKTTLASANYFNVLGVRPALGRFFVPDDDQAAGASPVAVISHRLWQTEFGAAPGAIGRAVRINGDLFTIVGVAPPGFHGSFIGFDMDLWLPVTMAGVMGAAGDLTEPNAHWLEVTGRLAPGATAATAQAEAAQLYAAVQAGRPAIGYDNGRRIVVLPQRPLDDSLRGTALGFASALAVIAGLVLLISCLNVGGLLLTRAEERRRENAVRLALGCSRARLLRQWLGETLALFAAGGVAGLLLSLWIADLGLFRHPTTFIPLAFDFAPDARAFAFCFGAALLAGLITGLGPAWRAARGDVVTDLKVGGLTASTSSGLRNTIVVAQLALALVPLVAAGLFARTLQHAARLSPGFSPDNLLVTSLNLTQLGDLAKNGPAAAQRLLEAAQALPGVESAALASRLPLGTGSLGTYVLADDPVAPLPERGVFSNLTFADPAYFGTLRIPLLAGRAFDDTDHPGSPSVAILNETLARQLFGSAAAAVGREIKRGRDATRVVGVARDVNYSRLWEEPRPQFYLPVAKNPRARLVLAVRTQLPPETIAPSLFKALRAAQPDLPLAPPRLGTDQIAITLLPQKIGAQISFVLGGLCLLLAAAGLYSVLSLGAVRQAREFGIRVALGAQRTHLAALVTRRVALLVGFGVLIGGALAFSLTRLLQGFLHGVSGFDPVTYAAIALLLATTAAAAAWRPARHAMQADPMSALRAE